MTSTTTRTFPRLHVLTLAVQRADQLGTVEAAQQLVEQGADYLGVGPTYATSTKEGLPDPLGPEGVGEVTEVVDVPVSAIADISVRRVPEVLVAGAHGVAVVGEVATAPDPGEVVRDLLERIDDAEETA